MWLIGQFVFKDVVSVSVCLCQFKMDYQHESTSVWSYQSFIYSPLASVFVVVFFSSVEYITQTIITCCPWRQSEMLALQAQCPLTL